jgi:lipopolysaccharide transport protein LptA
MHILKDVKAEKLVEKERKAFIRSQTADLSAKTHAVKFEGNVVLDMDSMRITGPHARFDYDDKLKLVRSAVFSGGARVSDTEKWGTAQNLEVDFTQDKYVFKGDPRVVQNNDELRGEEIIFLDGGKQVQVKRARAKVDEKHLETQKQ